MGAGRRRNVIHIRLSYFSCKSAGTVSTLVGVVAAEMVDRKRVWMG